MTTRSNQDGVHYRRGGLEPLDFIVSNDMGFREGCIVKYITRYLFKGTPLEDLNKAKFYIEELIAEFDSAVEGEQCGGADEADSH